MARSVSSRSARLVAASCAALALVGGAVALAPAAGAAAAAPAIADPVPPGGSFVPVTPTRVLDTREGGGTVHYADVDPRGVVPRFGTVAAVLLNVTVVDATGPGFVTVGPASGTSNGNYVGGPTASATLALVPYTSGTIRITPSTPANLVVDVQGYVTTQAAATSSSFTPLDPARRVADTRTRTGLSPFTTGQTQRLDVRTGTSIPADATAVIANLTVASATAPTYVTAWSGKGDRPTVSSVNAAAGDIVANRALIPLDAGSISLFNFAGRTDLVVDVVGYVSPDAGGSYYTPVTPTRLLDSSGFTAASAQPTITTSAGDDVVRGPSAADLAPTTAAWLTVVGDQPAGPGFVTARAGGSDPTATSDLNLVPFRAVANAGPVLTSSTDGTVTVSASVPTRLVADLAGWFRQARTPAAGLWRTSVLSYPGAPARVDTLPTGLPVSFAGGVYNSTPGFPEARAYAVTPDGTVARTVLTRSLPGSTPLLTGPTPLGSLTGVGEVVSAGDDLFGATYALDDQGRLFGWNSNSFGEQATRPTDSFDLDAVNQIALPGDATAVFAAPGIGYAVLDDDAHTVVSWGRADTAQLGRTATSTPWKPAPVTFPTGTPRQIAGDGRVSFGIDATGLTTMWGSPLPAGGGSTPTVQATPALFLGGCLAATSLHADTDGVWELCTDGTVVQLTSQGRLFASPQVLPVSGVKAVGPGLGSGSGVRVLLSDGRVADVTTAAAQYEAGFDRVMTVTGTREIPVTAVMS